MHVRALSPLSLRVACRRASTFLSAAFVYCAPAAELTAQLVINEVLSANSCISLDDEGDRSGWVEIVNSGDAPVQLGGYGLSDQEEKRHQWVLPRFSLEPSKHLLIWCSGKDRVAPPSALIDGSNSLLPFEATLIAVDSEWSFLTGLPETPGPPENWNQLNFDDSEWQVGSPAFGFGAEDVRTVLPSGAGAVFLRHVFRVEDPSAVSTVVLKALYDDGLVVYLNGIRIRSVNFPENETPTFSSQASRVHVARRAELFDLSRHRQLLHSGDNLLAIALLNQRPASRSLLLVPELGVVPPAFHANFRLREAGGPLLLSDAGGVLVDSLSVPPQTEDRSFGRFPDASGPFSCMLFPTPERANDNQLTPTPTPGDEEVPSDATVCLAIQDLVGDEMDVAFFGRRVTEPPDDFTVIAVPDTQFYSLEHPAIFRAQTQWIVANREKLNIVFVTHLGDCVCHADSVMEWENADAAMRLLEDPNQTGLRHGIPYGVAVGNHDQDPRGEPGTLDNEGSTTTLYNEYFGIDRFSGRSYYGGHFGTNNDNHYQLFEAGGLDFIIVHLEYHPISTPLRRAVLDWADQLLERHAARRAIITSHHFLNENRTFSEQGRVTYDKLKDNDNVFMMLCGHITQAARRTDVFECSTVHTILSDYQNERNGWLRILRFAPRRKEIAVQTYSPWLDTFKPGDDHNFSLRYDMDSTEFIEIGRAKGATSGTVACVPWPGRQRGVDYEWFAEVSNAARVARSPRWTFSTRDGAPLFLRGDANSDGSRDISDAMTMLNALFGRGPRSRCRDSADADDNGVLNVADAAFVLDRLFRGGPGFPEPMNFCSEDPTDDGLDCSERSWCE